MNTSSLIRTIDAIETPAPGRWALGPAPSIGVGAAGQRAGRRARDITGHLVVHERPGIVRLDLELHAELSATDTVPVHLSAMVVDASAGGRWTFAGHITVDSVTSPVQFDADYHGVFRRLDGGWTWLTFTAVVPGPDRHGLRLLADVAFAAPDPALTAAAA